MKVFLHVKLRGDSREKRLTSSWSPCCGWLGEPQTDQQPLRSFLHFQETIKESFKEDFPDHGYLAFYERLPAAAPRIRVRCPGLAEAIGALDAFRRTSGVQRLADQLAVKTIGAVRQTLSGLKRSVACGASTI